MLNTKIPVRFTDHELPTIRDATVFGFIDAEVEASGKVALLRMRTSASGCVRTTLTLTAMNIARVVIGASYVTVTRFATISVVLRETPVLRKTSVAITTRYVALADALATVNVAAYK